MLSKNHADLIDTLRKMVDVIDQLPIWTFDTATLRKFDGAYLIPILTTAGFPVAKGMLHFFSVHQP
jgi:hypothetical protein